MSWNLLWGLCQQGFDTDARYYAVQGKRADGTEDPSMPVRVDVVNLIDYMLGIFYTGNDDAPVTLGGSSANNFFAIRNRRLEHGTAGSSSPTTTSILWGPCAASTTTAPVRSPPASRAITSTRSGCTRS